MITQTFRLIYSENDFKIIDIIIAGQLQAALNRSFQMHVSGALAPLAPQASAISRKDVRVAMPETPDLM